MQQCLLLLKPIIRLYILPYRLSRVLFKILISNACIVLLLNISREKFRGRRAEHGKMWKTLNLSLANVETSKLIIQTEKQPVLRA